MKKLIIVLLFLTITLVSCNNERRYQIIVRKVPDIDTKIETYARNRIYIFDKDTGECNTYLDLISKYEKETLPPELD